MRTECRLERPKWLSFHTKPHETPQYPQTRPYPGPQPGETRTPVLGYGFSGVRVRVAPENPRVTRADLYRRRGITVQVTAPSVATGSALSRKPSGRAEP